MVGQMLLVGFRGTEAATDSAIVRQVRAGMVGGVILFDRDVTTGSRERNIVSPDQLARYQRFRTEIDALRRHLEREGLLRPSTKRTQS